MAYFKFLYSLENCGDDDIRSQQVTARNFHRAYGQFYADVVEAAGLDDGNVNVWSVEQIVSNQQEAA